MDILPWSGPSPHYKISETSFLLWSPMKVMQSLLPSSSFSNLWLQFQSGFGPVQKVRPFIISSLTLLSVRESEKEWIQGCKINQILNHKKRQSKLIKLMLLCERGEIYRVKYLASHNGRVYYYVNAHPDSPNKVSKNREKVLIISNKKQ